MGKKVLIIDDDQYLRELYVEVLKEAGYKVASAQDGVEGLATMEQASYDLILLDVVMPHLDGLGVLKQLEASKTFPKHGPIILLTNLAHDPVIDEALKRGITSYLIKSDITPDQLLASVKRLL